MAATLDELMMLMRAKKAEAQSLASDASSNLNTGLAIGSGALGLVGAIAAPVAAKYIGDAFGLNRRSDAENQAIARVRDVAEGGRTAAQAALEYQRARTQRMSAQAAAQGPARERAARQLVGQEQNIAAQQDLTAQAAQVKMREQARAQGALADIETRAGEAERQRQRQLVAGAVTGGLGALSQAYGGYMAGQQRAKDLTAQAAGAQAAINSIRRSQKDAMGGAAPAASAPGASAQQTPDDVEAVGSTGPTMTEDELTPSTGIENMTPSQFQFNTGLASSTPRPRRFAKDMANLSPELTMGPVSGLLSPNLLRGLAPRKPRMGSR